MGSNPLGPVVALGEKWAGSGQYTALAESGPNRPGSGGKFPRTPLRPLAETATFRPLSETRLTVPTATTTDVWERHRHPLR
jgi:hypothetical protein